MGNSAKRIFDRFRKYGFLAELQVIMSRDSRILLFSHHNYQVSLNEHHFPTSLISTVSRDGRKKLAILSILRIGTLAVLRCRLITSVHLSRKYVPSANENHVTWEKATIDHRLRAITTIHSKKTNFRSGHLFLFASKCQPNIYFLQCVKTNYIDKLHNDVYKRDVSLCSNL